MIVHESWTSIHSGRTAVLLPSTSFAALSMRLRLVDAACTFLGIGPVFRRVLKSGGETLLFSFYQNWLFCPSEGDGEVRSDRIEIARDPIGPAPV